MSPVFRHWFRRWRWRWSVCWTWKAGGKPGASSSHSGTAVLLDTATLLETIHSNCKISPKLSIHQKIWMRLLYQVHRYKPCNVHFRATNAIFGSGVDQNALAANGARRGSSFCEAACHDSGSVTSSAGEAFIQSLSVMLWCNLCGLHKTVLT